MQAGDTLKSLARRVYGNEAYWYVLADANGLDEGSALVAGSTLTVPEVRTSLNDANTFKPYNPADVTGPTTPSLPYIPAPDQGCGAVGQLVMVAVMIVITVYTAGAATGAVSAAGSTFGSVMSAGIGALGTNVGAAAIGGFVGSVAGQAVGSAMGVASFSWRNAIATGLATAATAQLGAMGTIGKVASKFGGSAFARGAVGAAAGGLINQATSRIVGSDTSFSWKAIAISAVSGGIGASVAGPLASKFGADLGTETGQMVKDLIGGAGAGLVSSHLRRKAGLDEGVNNAAVLADAFGTALANRMTGQQAMLAAAHSGIPAPAAGPIIDTLAGESSRVWSEDAGPILLPGAVSPSVGLAGTAALGSVVGAGGVGSGLGTSRARVVELSARAGRDNYLLDQIALGRLEGQQVRLADGTEAEVSPIVEVTASAPAPLNPVLARNYVMAGVGVLRPDLFERQARSRAAELGVDYHRVAQMPLPSRSVPAARMSWEESGRALRQSDWAEIKGLAFGMFEGIVNSGAVTLQMMAVGPMQAGINAAMEVSTGRTPYMVPFDGAPTTSGQAVGRIAGPIGMIATPSSLPGMVGRASSISSRFRGMEALDNWASARVANTPHGTTLADEISALHRIGAQRHVSLSDGGIAQLAKRFRFNEHIFEAELNKAKVVGFHYEPGAVRSRIVPGTQTPSNPLGVYEGRIEFETAPGVWQQKSANDGNSSFFPASWSRVDVMYESIQGFRARQYLNPSKPSAWSGTTPSGVQVRGYDSPNLTIYPVY